MLTPHLSGTEPDLPFLRSERKHIRSCTFGSCDRPQSIYMHKTMWHIGENTKESMTMNEKRLQEMYEEYKQLVLNAGNEQMTYSEFKGTYRDA